jgi:hypothetical protein
MLTSRRRPSPSRLKRICVRRLDDREPLEFCLPYSKDKFSELACAGVFVRGENGRLWQKRWDQNKEWAAGEIKHHTDNRRIAYEWRRLCSDGRN